MNHKQNFSVLKRSQHWLDSKNRNTMYLAVFYCLIFLIALRVGSTSIFLVMLLGITILKMLLSRTLTVPKHVDLLVLSLAFGSYFAIELIHAGEFSLSHTFSLVFHLLSMPLFYWIGWQVLHSQPNSIQQQTIFQRTVYLIVIGNVLFAFLSLFKKLAFPDWYDAAFLAGRYGNKGLNNIYWERSVVDFWNNETILATGYNMHFVYLIALLPVLFWFRKYRTAAIGTLIGTGVALWAIYITGSRSNLMLILISVTFAVWYKYLTGEAIPSPADELRTGFIRSRLRFVTSIALILLAVLILVFTIDALKLLESSVMFQKKGFGIESILQDARWQFALEVVRNIPSHPFGLMEVTHAHNLWLDVAHAAGIIPMIFLILFSLTNLRLAKSIWQKYEKRSLTRLIGLSILLILNISFFLETVIRGLTSQLMFYNLIVGMLSRLTDDSDPIRITFMPVPADAIRKD